MNKTLFTIFIVALAILYIGCSKSNPTSPTTGSVTFKMSHAVSGTSDTLFFGANPSVNVKVTYIKATWPTGDTSSVSGLNLTWSKDTVYYVGYYTPATTGIYKFDFKGSVVSGGASYSATSRDTVN